MAAKHFKLTLATQILVLTLIKLATSASKIQSSLFTVIDDEIKETYKKTVFESLKQLHDTFSLQNPSQTTLNTNNPNQIILDTIKSSILKHSQAPIPTSYTELQKSLLQSIKSDKHNFWNSKLSKQNTVILTWAGVLLNLNKLSQHTGTPIHFDFDSIGTILNFWKNNSLDFLDEVLKSSQEDFNPRVSAIQAFRHLTEDDENVEKSKIYWIVSEMNEIMQQKDEKLKIKQFEIDQLKIKHQNELKEEALNLTKANQEIEKLKNDQKTYFSEVEKEAFKLQIMNLERKNKAQEERIEQISKELAEMEGQKINLGIELTNLQNLGNAKNSELARKLYDKDCELGTCLRANDNLQIRLTNLQINETFVKERLEDIKKEKNHLEDRIKILNSNLNTKETELQKLKDSFNKYQRHAENKLEKQLLEANIFKSEANEKEISLNKQIKELKSNKGGEDNGKNGRDKNKKLDMGKDEKNSVGWKVTFICLISAFIILFILVIGMQVVKKLVQDKEPEIHI